MRGEEKEGGGRRRRGEEEKEGGVRRRRGEEEKEERSKTTSKVADFSSPDHCTHLLCCSFPVPLSFADTFTMPLASMSKVTST